MNCEHPTNIIRICPAGKGACHCCMGCREKCGVDRKRNYRAGNMRVALENIIRNTKCGWARNVAREALDKDDVMADK